MARRNTGSGGGGGGGYSANDWVERWRDQTDTDIAALQRDYINAAKTMIQIQEWLKNHEQGHADDRQDRARIPDDIRGWISTAISIGTLILMLYLQSQH